MKLEPINQIELFGLDKYLLEFVSLYENEKLPNKILLSGKKGLGKSTLAYHLINYVLSKDEDDNYDLKKFKINTKNKSYKLSLNQTNPNFILIDLLNEKQSIDISQIRDLSTKLNKSSFNNKPRFVMIDNVEFLNVNSTNALLKILEEPPLNTFFILINNNRNIFSTLSSRCLNFKIFLTNEESKNVVSKILNDDINKYLNPDLINYYFTPGNIYNLINSASLNKYDIKQYDLKKFLNLIIKDNLYKKDMIIKNMVFDFFEFYFRKYNLL
jgi:DNA polymerase-3 subunit delta'